YFPLQSYGF
nr:Chain E, Spike protein S1 peptide [Severe acute respiratory syndrome coronavirus 2]7TLT_F Chain F, Spike protein S1 peptide [Severe acute respiratory syndrome coronavirus 2]